MKPDCLASKPVSGVLPPVANAPFAGQGLATAAADRATSARRGCGHSTGRRPAPSVRPPRGVVTHPNSARQSFCRSVALASTPQPEPTCQDSEESAPRNRYTVLPPVDHEAHFRPSTDQSGAPMEFSVGTGWDSCRERRAERVGRSLGTTRSTQSRQRRDWRRGWDSNPRVGYPTRRFRGAPVTTTSVPLRKWVNHLR
jgi:hypothetical protein